MHGVVEALGDVLSINLVPVVVAALEALVSLLAALHGLELDVNFALSGGRIELDMNDGAVFFDESLTNIVLDLLNPTTGSIRLILPSGKCQFAFLNKPWQ